MGTGTRILRTLAAFALAIGGAACASTTASPAAETTQKAGTTCFSVVDISSYQPLPGRYLYIRVGTNEHYLLTLNRPSKKLGTQAAMHIEISPNFQRVCSNERVPMTYHYQGSVGVYNIIDVEKVASLQEAEALAAERAGEVPPER